MRLSFQQFLLCAILCGASYAHETNGQVVLEKRVSLNVQGAKLKKVLSILGEQADVRFVYSSNSIDSQRKVTLNAVNKRLDVVLKELLHSYSIEFSVSDDKMISLTPAALEKERSLAVPDLTIDKMVREITGRVVGDNNEPLPGVNILVKGTSHGTTSDANGHFRIEITDDNSVLVFSFVGYVSQEIAVTHRSAIEIMMEADQKALEEVVVVGFGSQRKMTVTGSVASANLDAMRDAPNTNIIQSLQGTVPGLNVGPVTSAGATPSISVRGRNTISGASNVLIILDGVQYNNSLSSINPDDIASIDVLKDASSTAVYGAQAANGVLLITSRKGKSGKPRISLSSSYATQNPSGNVRPMNREEYLEKVRSFFYNEAYLPPDFTQPNPDFNIATRVDITMRDGNQLVPTDFNWYDAATNNGYINDNQLSISGSTADDRINYLISGSFTNQKGFILNDLFKRKSLRVNLETRANSWLKVGLQSFASFVNQDGAEPTMNAIFYLSPLLKPYDENGNLDPYPFRSVDPNPFLTYDVDDLERHNYLFANVYTNIDIPFIEGLSYRLNFGNNGRTDKLYYASKYGAGLTGEAYKTNQHYYDFTLDNILTYDRAFGNHRFTLTMLYGAIERKYESTTAQGTGFTRLTLGYNSIAEAAVQRTTSSAYQEALNYQMARLNYGLKDKYLLTATIRRDGFSGFAANNKWGVFPSISAGWILSEESFIQAVSVINFLKLRAGYGISGNQTSRYSSLDRVSTTAAYVFGDGGQTVFGQSTTTLPNPDLRWEKTYEVNVGLEFTLLSNRLSGVLDVYQRNTKDLLFTVQIPNITGFAQIPSNVGEVANRGVELNLNSRNIQKGSFSWNTTFNFSRNRNKVVELLGGGDLIASNLFIGHPIGAIYGYKTNGIYQLGDEIPAGYSPGTYRVIDYNGDGIVNTDDRYILGSSDPAYRFSILNTLQYKNFSLMFLINSIQGGRNNYLGGNSPSVGRTDASIRNNGIAGVNYWSPVNPNSPYAFWTGAAPTINPAIYYSRSFVRLQDITLSYKLPGNVIQRLGLEALNLFVSGKNLQTWTKWKGWDPETGAGLSLQGRPVLQGVSVGFNTTF